MMQKHLDLLSTILARLGTGSASAEAAIASASAAVQIQAEKDYTIEVSTEARVKADAQSKREQLHADLKELRQAILNAKQAVIAAIRAAKGGLGGQ